MVSVTRNGMESEVHFAGRPAETFDQVIFSCHSDQALRMLAQPTPQKIAALSAIRYQDNQAMLHCVPRLMPQRRACWSSWVYNADTSQDSLSMDVIY